MDTPSRPEPTATKIFTPPLAPSRPEVDLSVVVPVFNESDLIESFILSWQGELQECGVSYEWVIVNDGSTDGTGRLLDRLRRDNPRLRVTHQLNSGHSGAVRRGYELARGRYVLQLDANGRYEPEDFWPLWERRESASLILAHRTHRIDSLFRRVFASLLTKTANLLFHLRLEDPNVPLRLFRRSFVEPYWQSLPKDWASLNLSLSILVARESQSQVAEVKVPFRRRAKGESHLGIWALFELGSRYLTELLRLRFQMARQTGRKGTLQTERQAQAFN